MAEELKQRLNEISTYLSEGEAWHRRCANELRKMPNKRGFARHHDAESECDSKTRLKLDKLMMDNLKHSPTVDTAYVSRAESYAINGLEGFKQHFKAWVDREGTFLKSITTAIDLVRAEDIEIYSCLCCLSKEVKNEKIRAEWLYMGLEDAGWSGHDIRVVSKWLHDYFECKYDGGIIDYNIG